MLVLQVTFNTVNTKSNELDLVQIEDDEAIVVVNVTDVNDNAPQFRAGTFGLTFIVRPNTLTGQQIAMIKVFYLFRLLLQLQADDLDASSWIRYSLVPTTGDDADLFRIEPEMGALIANADFSKQTKEKYVINIAATDGEFRTTTVVKVSQNMSLKRLIIIVRYSN